MRIYVTHSQYKKVNNKWIVEKEKPKTKISEQRYFNLMHDKLKGDRRQYKYSYEFGQRLMTRLTHTDNSIYFKSVRVFEFESEA